MIIPLQSYKRGSNGDTRRDQADTVGAAHLQQHSVGSAIRIGCICSREAVGADVGAGSSHGGGGGLGGVDFSGRGGSAYVSLAALVRAGVVAGTALDAVALVEGAQVVRDRL